jgi:hypothetical protein
LKARIGSRRHVPEKTMGSRKGVSSLVRNAFPGRDAQIERCFSDHPTFRELCADYDRCSQAHEHWRHLDDDAYSFRCREYAELLAELAEELERWLDNAVQDSPRPDGRESR